jgi:hypothetical protein
MRWCLVVSLSALITCSFSTVGAKSKHRADKPTFHSPPASETLPPDLRQWAGPQRAVAVADTFELAWFDFDTNNQPDPQGWMSIDWTAQIDEFFHIAGSNELDGGTYGTLLPVEGNQSVWCGAMPATGPVFCRYATLPGYGDGWEQYFVSKPFDCDSIRFCYKVQWDSEENYDFTYVEYLDDASSTWVALGVNNGTGYYDNAGALDECFSFTATNNTTRIRFRFESDGAWSDEDGLWPTDGAVLIDSVTVECFDSGLLTATFFEDFEDEVPGAKTTDDGCWSATPAPSYGDFAALYPGTLLLQEDPCVFNNSYMWAFIVDPLTAGYECHTPDPRPDQGVVPFGNADGRYIANSIWSPKIPMAGAGNEFRLTFQIYRDMPLDNLVFYTWDVRTIVNDCPGTWRDFGSGVYYGGHRSWLTATFQMGSIVDVAADEIQIAIGVVDMCAVWCNVYGSGTCHTHAPLIDDVRLVRVNTVGPRYTVRHLELFQDNFAEDGTLTGTARADAAIDILPSSSPGILPGDSCTMTIAPVAGDPNTGVGPAAYAYVRVQNSNAPKSGAELGSGDTRAGLSGNRWPHITDQMIAGEAWAVFRLDSAITVSGHAVADRYCIDLNDNLFVPGDTVWYFFGADVDGTPNNGNENYWHRTLDGQGSNNVAEDINEAAADPCEFTILPAGGYNRGSDILYVDDTDDRGGPAQLSFDSALDMLDIRDLIDRYDVLAPSSAVGNSLASRVTNRITQVIDTYRWIIWNSGNLSSALVGDGTGNPEKSDDWGLLFEFLDTSTLGPALYLSGDDIAEEWVTLAGAGAINTRSIYMNFNLLDGDHINHGEAVSPTLTATGQAFIHSGVPDVLIAYGGCPQINDFDVLQPTGTATTAFPYPVSGDGAVISQWTTNSAATTAVVLLSGFSYHYIRDAFVDFPPARVEHLRDILLHTGILPEATGVDPGVGPQYTNSLGNNYPNPFNPTTTIRYTIKERGNNYPNPFNPTTTIRYTIKERAHVSLKIYNAAGQLVRTLIEEVQAPDEVKPVEWDGRNNAGQTVSSGVYFYKLVTKGFSQTRKTVLLK